MGHTPGKLVVVDGRDLVTTDGKAIADVLDTAEGLEGSDSEADANATRLVLCWNTHDRLVGLAQDVVNSTISPMGTAYEFGRCVAEARAILIQLGVKTAAIADAATP